MPNRVRCPYDGTMMEECRLTDEYPGYRCLNCPHVEYDKNIPEDTRDLFDLGCCCGPCKEKGKRRGLRYW